jgi:hypothetical protein
LTGCHHFVLQKKKFNPPKTENGSGCPRYHNGEEALITWKFANTTSRSDGDQKATGEVGYKR